MSILTTTATFSCSESSGPETFWEEASQTRWGAYLSEVEARFIGHAHELSERKTNAIEIGVDGGRWAKMLADQGWHMTCTDIDAERLAICQQRIPSSTCVYVDPNSTEFPCENNFAQLLLAIEVHELVEQDWFMEETFRVLEPGGLFVGVFQNLRSWRALVRNRFADSDDSIVHYTAAYKPWKNKLIQRGFEIVREEGMCWCPFGRMSNSIFIPAAVRLERLMGLRKITSCSPWIAFIAQKVR